VFQVHSCLVERQSFGSARIGPQVARKSQRSKVQGRPQCRVDVLIFLKMVICYGKQSAGCIAMKELAMIGMQSRFQQIRHEAAHCANARSQQSLKEIDWPIGKSAVKKPPSHTDSSPN